MTQRVVCGDNHSVSTRSVLKSPRCAETCAEGQGPPLRARGLGRRKEPRLFLLPTLPTGGLGSPSGTTCT